MQDSSYEIVILDTHNEPLFRQMLEEYKFFGNDQAYYDRCFERKELKEIEIALAISENKAVGYSLLNWQPKYAYFKKQGLPEIQDLNVISSHRRQGIGQAMVEFCEALVARDGYHEMGIGVGLDSSFGAAQRLYARLGYIPDGSGVSYDRKQVAAGEFRPIDDNLCLMMTKKLK